VFERWAVTGQKKGYTLINYNTERVKNVTKRKTIIIRITIVYKYRGRGETQIWSGRRLRINFLLLLEIEHNTCGPQVASYFTD
jgi:hypothetical protein